MDFRDERERLIAEQAVLQYRAVQEAAAAAKYGHGLEAMELAALAGSREHGRRLLSQAMQAASEKETTKPRARRVARQADSKA